MTTSTPNSGEAAVLPMRTVTLGWAVKRALVGILILFVVIWGAAWLLHTSIDPRLEADTSRTISTGPDTLARPGARF